MTHRAILPLSVSLQDLQAARKLFEANEPRDLFYRAATELVDLAIRRATSLSVAEALAVLLQTWNSSFYRFHSRFDAQHFKALENVLSQHSQILATFRQRELESLSKQDEAIIAPIFKDCENLLGAVGAAKALHLLAPGFFPLWDRRIAAAYGVGLKGRGLNAPQYLRFMQITKGQCDALGGYQVIAQTIGRNPLKALDEFNYCKFVLQIWPRPDAIP